MILTLVIETENDVPNFKVVGANIKKIIFEDLTEESEELGEGITAENSLSWHEEREFVNRYGPLT